MKKKKKEKSKLQSFTLEVSLIFYFILNVTFFTFAFYIFYYFISILGTYSYSQYKNFLFHIYTLAVPS